MSRRDLKSEDLAEKPLRRRRTKQNFCCLIKSEKGISLSNWWLSSEQLLSVSLFQDEFLISLLLKNADHESTTEEEQEESESNSFCKDSTNSFLPKEDPRGNSASQVKRKQNQVLSFSHVHEPSLSPSNLSRTELDGRKEDDEEEAWTLFLPPYLDLSSPPLPSPLCTVHSQNELSVHCETIEITESAIPLFHDWRLWPSNPCFHLNFDLEPWPSSPLTGHEMTVNHHLYSAKFLKSTALSGSHRFWHRLLTSLILSLSSSFNFLVFTYLTFLLSFYFSDKIRQLLHLTFGKISTALAAVVIMTPHGMSFLWLRVSHARVKCMKKSTNSV